MASSTGKEGASRTGAQTLVDTLAAEGVRQFFGIPGEHCLGIVDAVSRRDDLRFISVRHESAAALMAEAHGKLTGEPAACLATASVGSANLVAGVNVAHHDSTPMVVLVGQVANRYLGREAWQEIDQVALFDPICRSATQITHVEKLVEMTQRALMLARTGRPGPVMLSIPVDVQDGPGPEPADTPAVMRAPALSDQSLREVAELLRGAERPLLVVGGGIRAAGARDDLTRLAETVGMPVLTAFRRTDAFPNDSEYYVGALGLSASDVVRETMERADLLLVIGTRLSELNSFRYAFPTAAQQHIHIDIDPRTLAAQSPPAQLSLVGDAGLAIRGLLRECERVGVRKEGGWWRSQRTARAESGPTPSADPSVERIRAVAEQIDALLPDDAVVTTDAGDFFLGCAPAIEFNEGRRLLGPTSGSMGYGLPSAIAAKLASPRRVCVALCGDGGFMMSVQELETAVRYGVNVVVVVFNNKAYGSIVRHQKARFDSRLVGTELGNPPLAELAELFGARGHRVSAVDDFTEAFKEAVATDRVSLIEVLV
jgi:acetolactate synthase I/II/III large subunit